MSVPITPSMGTACDHAILHPPVQAERARAHDRRGESACRDRSDVQRIDEDGARVDVAGHHAQRQRVARGELHAAGERHIRGQQRHAGAGVEPELVRTAVDRDRDERRAEHAAPKRQRDRPVGDGDRARAPIR